MTEPELAPAGVLGEAVRPAIALTQSWLLHGGGDGEEWRQMVDLVLRLTWPDMDPLIASQKAILSFTALAAFLADQVARARTDGKPSFGEAHRVLSELGAAIEEWNW